MNARFLQTLKNLLSESIRASDAGSHVGSRSMISVAIGLIDGELSLVGGVPGPEKASPEPADPTKS